MTSWISAAPLLLFLFLFPFFFSACVNDSIDIKHNHLRKQCENVRATANFVLCTGTIDQSFQNHVSKHWAKLSLKNQTLFNVWCVNIFKRSLALWLTICEIKSVVCFEDLRPWFFNLGSFCWYSLSAYNFIVEWVELKEYHHKNKNRFTYSQ